MRLAVPIAALALVVCGCATADGTGGRAAPPPAAAEPFPLTESQRAAGVVVPEIGDLVRPGPDGWFACRSQRLVLAAWFARLARHAGAVRALFRDQGDGVACVHLDRDDPSIASIRAVDAADDRLGEATIRLLTLRLFFPPDADGTPRSVEMSALAGVAGGLEGVPREDADALP